MKPILASIAWFAAAALCEIGGGYLVWQWRREGAPLLTGLLGATLLVLYGVVPTLQNAPFGRTYAAYGGVFVVASLLWGRVFDGHRPDRFDMAGAFLCLAGVAVIMYAPRD